MMGYAKRRLNDSHGPMGQAFSKEKNYFQLYRSVDGRRYEPHGPRQFEGTYVNEYDGVFLHDGTCKLLAPPKHSYCSYPSTPCRAPQVLSWCCSNRGSTSRVCSRGLLLVAGGMSGGLAGGKA